MAAYLPSLASLINGIILIGLGLGVTWWWKTYDARQTKAKEAATDKVQWRKQRLDVEHELAEALKAEAKSRADADGAERLERIQWQLKREAELASIAGILEESTEAHKLLASIAATTQAHGGQLTQLHQRLETMQNHINQLSLHHAKP